MKKKFLWLFLLVPAFFIAASSPISNMNMDWQSSGCSSWGEKHKNWDGNSGCGYVFDFSSLINSNCTLTAIDLDISTPEDNDYFFEDDHVLLYVTNGTGADGKITMYPKPGYTGAGFVNGCHINVHFSDGTYEYALWTMIIDSYSGPYPIACY